MMCRFASYANVSNMSRLLSTWGASPRRKRYIDVPNSPKLLTKRSGNSPSESPVVTKNPIRAAGLWTPTVQCAKAVFLLSPQAAAAWGLKQLEALVEVTDDRHAMLFSCSSDIGLEPRGFRRLFAHIRLEP